MKNTALAVFVILLFTFGMAASYASAIYQDDFQVNDYTLRYTTWNAWKDGWWPNDFTYVDLGGGSTGFAPSGGWWSSAIDTKDYLNGHFTDTSYAVTVALQSPTTTLQPYFSFGLLNNGIVTPGETVFKGYSAQFQNNVGKVSLVLSRINSDGSSTSLIDHLNDPFQAADLSQWSNFTATVDVRATETYLKLKWDGVDALGNPSSYFDEYHDTSAQRWTSGTGLGMTGWGGANAPAFNGLPSGITVDNLLVSTIVAAPTFIPGGGNFTSPVNVTINCATPGATISYTTDGSTPTSTHGASISAGSSVLVDHAMTLKAVALVTGHVPSDVTSRVFTFDNLTYIYKDDFQVNDFDSRYTFRRTDANYWWPANWTYPDLGGGNMGLAPGADWYPRCFDTKDYLNGHFTNTSYTAKVALNCVNDPDGPSLSFTLLNNGFIGSSLGVVHN